MDGDSPGVGGHPCRALFFPISGLRLPRVIIASANSKTGLSANRTSVRSIGVAGELHGSFGGKASASG